MAPPLSRIKFFFRVGGIVGDLTGEWHDFEAEIGCIEDWSGLLSEGPIGGDTIVQDWTDGAIWQQGPHQTYSFDVPFTSKVTDKINPNILDSYAGIYALRGFRGPVLTLRREYFDTTGVLVAREQALGVQVSSLTMKVSVGRVISSIAIFQQLSGDWTIVGITP